METMLPPAFFKRMHTLLGSEFDAYLACMETPPRRGLRVNLLKMESDGFYGVEGFRLTGMPFCPEGFYQDGDASGHHPWHHAGAYYLQEPSAMCAARALDVSPGQRVLDLCAAPGGKSTQIAAYLKGRGLLICNEIIPKRAQALLSNIERCGVRNAVVTCEEPGRLCPTLPGFFDRVLVDAPCSGEGMFRRDPEAAAQWNEKAPEACARRQIDILCTAADTVCEGGALVYSTCTFSPEEDEGVTARFLVLRPDFVLEAAGTFGRASLPGEAGADFAPALARRVFPMDGGEGCYVAKFRRTGPAGGTAHAAQSCAKPRSARMSRGDAGRQAEALRLFEAFYSQQFSEPPFAHPVVRGDMVFLEPEGLPELAGLRVLRAGVPAGRVKNGRFEPEHALYLAAAAKTLRRAVNFCLTDPRLEAFLAGEEIEAPEGLAPGYAAVLAQGVCTGFCKCAGGALKNHYPRGLRNL